MERSHPASPLLLATVVAFLGCTSASKVNTSGPETKPYAPVNTTADGDVSYLNAGAKVVRDARRDDAFKKMHAFCDGPYEIVREEDQESALFGGPQRRIWFNCLPKEESPEAPIPAPPGSPETPARSM